MLKIIDNLSPFFEDCYRRVNVREYARITNISPPTASKLLASYTAEGLLAKEKLRNYIFYYANKASRDFIDLSRIYWKHELNEAILHIQKNLVSPSVVLFGSLSKAEAKSDSDVDLAIFAQGKELDFGHFEKKIKRRIQAFWFKSLNDVKNKELASNIINGYLLSGRLSL